MHRFFDALDGTLSTLVPLLYLVGLAAGTLAYFSGLVVDFNVAVGVSLAIAAECHSYLVQRRMRMARARLNRATVADSAYGSLEAQYTRQRNILIGLLIFSVYNSVQFVASTWTPTGWLPAPLQIFVRGAIIPGLFFLAGELTPLITEPGDVLAHASREMTFNAVRTMSQQWRRRLRRARRRNLDLAPIAVTLLHDAGDFPGAQRIRMIAEGLTAAEEGRMPLPVLANDTARVIEATPVPSGAHVGTPTDRPPTGPGSPVVITPAHADDSSTGDGRIVQLPTRIRRPSARRRTAASGRGPRQSVEQRARAVWTPGMTGGELQRAAGKSAASKYRKILAAESAVSTTAEIAQ